MHRTEPGVIHTTGLTGAVTTATLCAASAGACNVAGLYRVDFGFSGGGTACSSVTAGSVKFNLTWTDSGGNAHSAVNIGVWDQKTLASGTSFNFNTALTTEGAAGTFAFYTNGTVIQYSTSYTACTTGTGTYQLDATVTRLN